MPRPACRRSRIVAIVVLIAGGCAAALIGLGALMGEVQEELAAYRHREGL